MIAISTYGRGGQGAVKAAQLLAVAAFIEGFHVQSFPFFGVERRGAPVQAFVRIDKEPILTRSQIKEADYAIILDPSLYALAKAKKILVNTSKKIQQAKTFDAASLALKVFPQGVNTAMVCAFVLHTNIIKVESLIQACRQLFSEDALNKNLRIIKEVQNTIR